MSFEPHFKLMQAHRAYSLIFVFIIVTVFMLVASTTIQNTNDSLADYDPQSAADAQNAADAAAGSGILAMKSYNPGYESYENYAFCYKADGTQNTTGNGDCATWGNYRVFGKAQQNSNDPSGPYYIPMPGTGTAASSKDCTLTDSDHDGDFDNDMPVNDPCNWNKMLASESVSIPLYTDDGSGGLLFPSDLSGFVGWSLKVRTPCVDPTDDPETCTRYELDDGVAGSSYSYASDDSVILWQLNGTATDSTGADYTIKVVPDDAYQTVRGNKSRDVNGNTEIYESLINSTSNNYVVLKAADTAPYTDLYNACMGDSDGDGTTDLTLSTLTLQMDIVTALKEVTTGDSVPYLEWQLTIDSTEPFADNKSVILGEGYRKGTKNTFYSKKIVTRSTTGESSSIYTLSN